MIPAPEAKGGACELDCAGSGPGALAGGASVEGADGALVGTSADADAGCTPSAYEGDLLSLEALLLGRAYLYALFHKVFGGEPDDRLLCVIGQRVTIDALDEFAASSDTLAKLRDFAARVGARAADVSFVANVREEFALFFEGPVEPPAFPWESPYLNHEPTVFQPSTLVVRKAYAAQGLRVKRYQRVPDDHVSIMCAFMAELGKRTHEAFCSDALSHARALVCSQYEFVENHLLNWLPVYAERALGVKKAYLYPQFAQGVAAFAQVDATFLAEMLAWLDEAEAQRGVDGGASGADRCDVSGGAGEHSVLDGAGGCDICTTHFPEVEEALAQLEGLHLRGMEDNELVSVA